MAEYKRPQLETVRKRILSKHRFIQVIAGPRQVGKTTLVQQLIDENTIFSRFYSADGVTDTDASWLDSIWENFRTELRLKKAGDGLLVIDEIQKIPGWSECVKKNWDEDGRNKIPVKLIILGSSRLLLQEGLSESLLGRYELNYLGHWALTEMEEAFGFSPEEYVWFGGYPGTASLIKDESRFKNYILNSIIEPSLSRDILMLTRVSKPALLRQLFELGTSYSAQILSFNKILGALRDAGNTTTLSRYILLLDQAGLLAGLQKYGNKPVAAKASIPKFQVHNTALLSALRTETFKEARQDRELWGRVWESAAGSYLINQVRENAGYALYYWRQNNDEVDFVVKRGNKIAAFEIKSGRKTGSGGNLSVFKNLFPSSKTLLVGGQGFNLVDFLKTPVRDLLEAV
jgi:predicted AAA+ superfamily ATPase